ncbi:hypothetical protein FEM48_Zijuj04G0202500 [Ziziphus jujuba var. spinosa]|uniref:ZF-HD dimerization-type domain-containing protein n=1 Tax=Ziziphus jujuba var. spinosa TaxID=714518 RepID=A0A978VLZ2_ZIZJJ|nr:hypothetical protein FEM48_Zijuj04G0202500 [Ziziphus jujuba var. spinosa]
MSSNSINPSGERNGEIIMEEQKKVAVYKECLKNHAAAIGGIATDGCGEFMPAGKLGTVEALKCSACNCHRNFHRKHIQPDGCDRDRDYHSSSPVFFLNHNNDNNAAGKKPIRWGHQNADKVQSTAEGENVKVCREGRMEDTHGGRLRGSAVLPRGHRLNDIT